MNFFEKILLAKTNKEVQGIIVESLKNKEELKEEMKKISFIHLTDEQEKNFIFKLENTFLEKEVKKETLTRVNRGFKSLFLRKKHTNYSKEMIEYYGKTATDEWTRMQELENRFNPEKEKTEWSDLHQTAVINTSTTHIEKGTKLSKDIFHQLILILIRNNDINDLLGKSDRLFRSLQKM